MTARRKHGGPPERATPEPIDAEPEDNMRAVLSTLPKKRDEWRYLTDGDWSEQP